MGPKAELDKLREAMGPLGTKFYELDANSVWHSTDRPGADTHVTLHPYFTVPDGKMEEFKAGFAGFHEGARTGSRECLYYGFAIDGNKVFCREGYTSAAGVLTHLRDVKGPLDAAVAMVGAGGLDLSVMGPKAELDKLREALGPLGTKFYELDSNGSWYSTLPDVHLTVCPYFTVPEGKMEEFMAGFSKFYEKTKAGTKECLYFGFAVCGNKVYCREGYKSADGVMEHLGDVKDHLEAAVALVGPGGLDLSVMGPREDLEKLKPAMGPLGTKFYELDPEGFWMSTGKPGPDTHVSLCPYFTVPEGKMEEFKTGFANFYTGTRAGNRECLYYGFAIQGNTVFCREAYTSAAGVLAHLGDVKGPLDAAVALVGAGGLDLSVMGPKAELEKLKEAMGPLGTKFYELDSNSVWFY